MSSMPLSRAAILRARLWRLAIALVRGSLTIMLALALAWATARGATHARSTVLGGTAVAPVDELGLLGGRDAAERGQRAARRMSLSQPGRGWTANDAVEAGWLPPDDAGRIALIATPDGVRVLPRPVRAGFAPGHGAH